MNKIYDVAIVGSGLAGSVAAKTARDENLDVLVLSKNSGFTGLNTGSLDILGAIPGKDVQIVEQIEEGLKVLVKENPDHPYSKTSNYLAKGVEKAKELLTQGGYNLYGNGTENLYAPNTLGTFSIYAYVPSTSKAAVNYKNFKDILIVNFDGYNDMDSSYLAKSFSEINGRASEDKINYYSADITLEKFADSQRLSASEIADFLDTEEGLRQFQVAIQEILENVNFAPDCIFLPPVLGIENYNYIVENTADTIKCEIAELIGGFSNPVVGARYTKAIYTALEQSGVDLKRGYWVESIESDENEYNLSARAGVVDQFHPGQEVALRAKSVILAPGGFIGGGLVMKDREVLVPTLDLNLGSLSEKNLVADSVFESAGHDFLEIGLQTDENLKLLNADFSGDLFVCGDILSGAKRQNEKSSAGIAASSGVLATISAINSLKE